MTTRETPRGDQNATIAHADLNSHYCHGLIWLRLNAIDATHAQAKIAIENDVAQSRERGPSDICFMKSLRRCVSLGRNGARARGQETGTDCWGGVDVEPPRK